MKPGKMPRFGGMDMNSLMKQAQKMQEDVAKLQQELDEREFSATSGGGAVKATVAGKKLVGLEISPDVVDPEDVEMLADLVIAAANEALSQYESTVNAEMGKLTGGIPGLM